MELFRLFGSILIDNDKANESISKTEGKADSLGGKLGGMIGTAAKWGAGLVAGAGAAVGGMLALANKTAETADVIDKLSERTGINREELQRIFDSDYYRSANYNRSYQYWVIHLAAFTGARVNELAQLSPSDIEKDKDGLWFIKITAALDEGEDSKSLKNEESRRLIPVHQKLIDLGFISYVEKKKKEGVSNLFGINPAKADKYGKAPSQWFNNKYLRDFLKIDDPAVVFHSFRHRFITSLSQAIIDNSGLAEETILKERIPEALVLRRIAGHSVAHALTAGRSQYDIHTDTYTGEFSIASMKRVIDRLDYPGVVFHKYQELDVGKKKRMKKTAEKQDIDLIMVSPGDWIEIMS